MFLFLGAGVFIPAFTFEGVFLFFEAGALSLLSLLRDLALAPAFALAVDPALVLAPALAVAPTPDRP